MKNLTKSTEFLVFGLVVAPTLLGVFSDHFQTFALGSAAILLCLVAALSLPQWFERLQEKEKQAE